MIDTKKFFIAGIVAFTIIGLANLINFFIFYYKYNFFSHVASLTGIAFNFITAAFFLYLLKTMPTASQDIGDIKNINEAIEEFKNGRRKKGFDRTKT